MQGSLCPSGRLCADTGLDSHLRAGKGSGSLEAAGSFPHSSWDPGTKLLDTCPQEPLSVPALMVAAVPEAQGGHQAAAPEQWPLQI